MLEVTFTIIRRNQFYKLVAATQKLNKNIESLFYLRPQTLTYTITTNFEEKHDFYTCKKSCKYIYFDSPWHGLTYFVFIEMRFHARNSLDSISFAVIFFE